MICCSLSASRGRACTGHHVIDGALKLDANSSRHKPKTKSDTPPTVSAGSHRQAGPQPSFRPPSNTFRQGPFLPAGHQGLAAATRPGKTIGVSSVFNETQLMSVLFSTTNRTDTNYPLVGQSIPVSFFVFRAVKRSGDRSFAFASMPQP